MLEKVSQCETFVNRKVSDYAAYFSASDCLETFGMTNRIKEFRKTKGLSQEVLAERLRTTKSTISKLEKGDQPLTQSYMEKIAGVVGCKAYELIMPPEEAPSLNTPVNSASGLVDAYEALTEYEKKKARGFLEWVFLQEDGKSKKENSARQIAAKKNN